MHNILCIKDSLNFKKGTTYCVQEVEINDWVDIFDTEGHFVGCVYHGEGNRNGYLSNFSEDNKMSVNDKTPLLKIRNPFLIFLYQLVLGLIVAAVFVVIILVIGIVVGLLTTYKYIILPSINCIALVGFLWLMGALVSLPFQMGGVIDIMEIKPINEEDSDYPETTDLMVD